MRIAFQGIAGAFSEEAARAAFGAQAPLLPCPSFEAVAASVEEGACTHGVLPLYNREAGVVPAVAELLLRRRPSVHGAVDLLVRHQLLGLPGAPLEGIRRVRSHPHALRQCGAALVRLGLEPEEAPNTAVAARDVAALEDPALGALASERAAELYGLEVKLSDVHDDPQNTTRFLVLAPPPAPSLGPRLLVVLPPRADPDEGAVLFRGESGVLVELPGPAPAGAWVLGAYAGVLAGSL